MSGSWPRRRFLEASGAAVGGGLVAAALGGPALAAPALGAADPWRTADRIRRRVRAPRFPHRTLRITDFGAKGDGTTDCTRAFEAAISTCARRGGGHVVVPPGRYLTGPIRLRSHVDLHVSEGATIAFSTDPAKYPPVYTRWQGIECYNYSPFIYAYGARNIAISGTGTLDGQAGNTAWWPWSGSTTYGWKPGDPQQGPDWTLLQQWADQGVPVRERVLGAGHYLRPNMIQPYRCENVLIEGVTIVNSPMWEIHPVLSRNILVRDITVDSHGPNNDGCDPESCTDVVITGSTFDTGDDCIAIKAGRNADGRRVNVPSRNILVEDCEFRDGHGGVTIGSEMTGGVSAVFARNLRMNSPNLNSCLRLKTNSMRGGHIHDVHMKDVEVGQLAVAAIQIDFYYDEGPGHPYNPSVSGIHVENLHVGTTKYVLDTRGYPDDPIKDVTLTHCRFDKATAADVVENVEGLVLTDVTVNGSPAGAHA
ncbi:glycoside hydrolase family 28 protein [Actinoallomurus purpureus]|uniref:glycoside hydrolase family 28 protein n=1 Tax=Actinoallomurus purpureus TaxID=478114 RepID=UPI002092AC70|nr:glycoside hydrolase family 28 protein [Actinoallomurus purpureus]MCO6009388.1 glycoside hydrolase family 28 protein [Actinoallomurus purpureus]